MPLTQPVRRGTPEFFSNKEESAHWENLLRKRSREQQRCENCVRPIGSVELAQGWPLCAFCAANREEYPVDQQFRYCHSNVHVREGQAILFFHLLALCFKFYLTSCACAAVGIAYVTLKDHLMPLYFRWQASHRERQLPSQCSGRRVPDLCARSDTCDKPRSLLESYLEPISRLMTGKGGWRLLRSLFTKAVPSDALRRSAAFAAAFSKARITALRVFFARILVSRTQRVRNACQVVESEKSLQQDAKPPLLKETDQAPCDTPSTAAASEASDESTEPVAVEKHSACGEAEVRGTKHADELPSSELAATQKSLDGNWVGPHGERYSITFDEEKTWTCTLRDHSHTEEFPLHFDVDSHTVWWGDDGDYYLDLKDVTDSSNTIAWHPYHAGHNIRSGTPFVWYRYQASWADEEAEIYKWCKSTAIKKIERKLRSQGSIGRVWIPDWNAKYYHSLGSVRRFIESCPDRFRVIPEAGNVFFVELLDTDNSNEEEEQVDRGSYGENSQQRRSHHDSSHQSRSQSENPHHTIRYDENSYHSKTHGEISHQCRSYAGSSSYESRSHGDRPYQSRSYGSTYESRSYWDTSYPSSSSYPSTANPARTAGAKVWRKKNDDSDEAPSNVYDSLAEKAIKEIEEQLTDPSCHGFVWVDQWNERFLHNLGSLREFLSSRPDKFRVVPRRGKGYRVQAATESSSKWRGEWY